MTHERLIMGEVAPDRMAELDIIGTAVAEGLRIELDAGSIRPMESAVDDQAVTPDLLAPRLVVSDLTGIPTAVSYLSYVIDRTGGVPEGSQITGLDGWLHEKAYVAQLVEKLVRSTND